MEYGVMKEVVLILRELPLPLQLPRWVQVEEFRRSFLLELLTAKGLLVALLFIPFFWNSSCATTTTVATTTSFTSPAIHSTTSSTRLKILLRNHSFLPPPPLLLMCHSADQVLFRDSPKVLYYFSTLLSVHVIMMTMIVYAALTAQVEVGWITTKSSGYCHFVAFY